MKLLLLLFFAGGLYASSHTAASCSSANVDAVINGPTHTAVDGDVITIPAGNCTWTTGIIVPSGIGITITGTGTPNSTAATFGANASCTATELTITGATAFRTTPSYGNSTTRISCMKMVYGSGASIGISALGTCTSSGCPNVRVDNLTFTNWAGHASAGISYGINVMGNLFGVADHNTITGTRANYLEFIQLAHASYLGVGHWGDKAWASADDFGTEKSLYFENNVIATAGLTEHEGSAGGLGDAGGGRIVARFNHFTDMDYVNFAMGWHGTESYGRPRGFRAFEFYKNTHDCTDPTYNCTTIVAARSGTGLAWGNTTTGGNAVNGLMDLSTYRILQNVGGWGACDGAAPWDTNDGTTYYSGTITSVSGSNPYTITVSGSPGWTTNQWVNASPYSLHDSTIDDGAQITANGSNTITVAAWTSSAYANGDSIQILRATACLDQAGGRGQGILYDDANPATPTNPANQALSPVYAWDNTFGSGPGTWIIGTWPDNPRVIRNREFYHESASQAAQSSATSPFNGTTTIGMGHGIVARRPTTCTTGVGYWATDEGSWNGSGSGGQGNLYLCTSTNTWTLSYTPYTYPHPLVSGSPSSPTVTTTTASSITTTTASSGGNVTSDGGDSVTSRGVCYGASSNPTTPCTSDGTGTGSFTSSLSGLSAGTTYHYRAFATNGVGTSYGSDLTFSTSSNPTNTQPLMRGVLVR